MSGPEHIFHLVTNLGHQCSIKIFLFIFIYVYLLPLLESKAKTFQFIRIDLSFVFYCSSRSFLFNLEMHFPSAPINWL